MASSHNTSVPEPNHQRGDSYTYLALPSEASFRLAEISPGRDDDPITCTLHVVQWDNAPPYEALSYAWGDPSIRDTIMCDGRTIEVTKTLHEALAYLRYADRPRMLWADAICISQMNIPERSKQVKQMKKIYTHAQCVQIWLGPDDPERQAATATQSIELISDFLCKSLNVDISCSSIGDDNYQAHLLKNRNKLPKPDENDFSSKVLWHSLVVFYSHVYFTRVWAIQEVSANPRRIVNMGYSRVGWNQVDLVASYIIMEPSFAQQYEFSAANCWFVATISEIAMHPERWLNMLYLASSYGCLDPRDVIYGLRGMMDLGDAASLLVPDYNKSREEVYRDSVEAALIKFKRTDVLAYVTGKEHPSWVPSWDIPMLFRNPFRFGKPVPWRPSGDSHAIWSINKKENKLILRGSIVDELEYSEQYNQLWFADGTIDDKQNAWMLRDSWTRILIMLAKTQNSLPLSVDILGASAAALSFGLDHKLNASEQADLLHNFVAYLAMILADEPDKLRRYISDQLLEEAAVSDGRAFGKPVWDFEYPDASIFVTKTKSIGCSIAPTQAGDVVFVAAGSTYPTVLRPRITDSGQREYSIRGFCYIEEVMTASDSSHAMSDVTII